MALVNQGCIDHEIGRYGSTVDLIIKTSSVTDWGDESCSTTSSSIIAVHNDIQGGEEFNREGIYYPGDKIFFCKSDQDDLDKGNEIKFNSNYYKINEVIEHHLEDQDYVKEVRCGKVK